MEAVSKCIFVRELRLISFSQLTKPASIDAHTHNWMENEKVLLLSLKVETVRLYEWILLLLIVFSAWLILQ